MLPGFELSRRFIVGFCFPDLFLSSLFTVGKFFFMIADYLCQKEKSKNLIKPFYYCRITVLKCENRHNTLLEYLITPEYTISVQSAMELLPIRKYVRAQTRVSIIICTQYKT